MTPREFFDNVSLMRKAQKEYFKTRSPQILLRSKDLERLIDKEIERVNKLLESMQPKQQELFVGKEEQPDMDVHNCHINRRS